MVVVVVVVVEEEEKENKKWPLSNLFLFINFFLLL